MPWDEFCSYLTGIMPDTPLGNVIQIRSETDKNVLKNFTKEQKQIRNEWQSRQAKAIDTKDMEYKDIMNSFKDMFKNLAEGGKI